MIACAFCVGFVYVKKFTSMRAIAQIARVKSWLLFAVIEAERIYKSGTGALKLRYTYDLFVSRFGSLAAMVTFEMFSKWVDEVLQEMRHILETNKDIEAYVNDD